MAIELKKHPETEQEYWETIEGLGGMSWRLNHDLADGRIDDPSGKVSQDITDLQTLLEALVSEVCEKFGVIHPKDCPQRSMEDIMNDVPIPPAPEGKKYYRDWYNEQKQLSYSREYEGMICSACPFSEGLEHMMALGGQVPCGKFSGMLYRLDAPHLCGMVTWHNGWTKEHLYNQIQSEYGDQALQRFQTKEQALQNQSQTEPSV